jgi:hypothetical protein
MVMNGVIEFNYWEEKKTNNVTSTSSRKACKLSPMEPHARLFHANLLLTYVILFLERANHSNTSTSWRLWVGLRRLRPNTCRAYVRQFHTCPSLWLLKERIRPPRPPEPVAPPRLLPAACSPTPPASSNARELRGSRQWPCVYGTQYTYSCIHDCRDASRPCFAAQHTYWSGTGLHILQLLCFYSWRARSAWLLWSACSL